MKKFFTTTLAAVIAVGTVTLVSASPVSAVVRDHYCYVAADTLRTDTPGIKDDKNKKKIGGSDKTDNGDSLKKETIEKIQNTENEMYKATAYISGVLGEKRESLNAALRNENLSDSERRVLKESFYNENKDLIAALDKIREPYLEQIKKIQKNYVDSVFLY